jgi:hypothetical protein
MQLKIEYLPVQIVRFAENGCPGFVECEFTDAEDQVHVIIEKGPVVASEYLWMDGKDPVSGSMECVVVAKWRDAAGRELARIRTSNDSADGRSEFVVFSERLVAKT